MPVQAALLKEIEEKLEARRAQLNEELEHFATKQRGAPEETWEPKHIQVGRSEDDNATGVTMYSDNLSLERTLEHALRDVENAISRIQAGSYGMCRYCQQPIPEKRLRARPTSSSCVQCKIEKKKGA